jgi:hypothetical protein
MSEMSRNHFPIKHSVAVVTKLITTQPEMISVHMTYANKVSAMLSAAQSQLVVL